MQQWQWYPCSWTAVQVVYSKLALHGFKPKRILVSLLAGFLSEGSVARSSKGANKSFTDSSMTRLRFLILPYWSAANTTVPDSLTYTSSDIVSSLAFGTASLGGDCQCCMVRGVGMRTDKQVEINPVQYGTYQCLATPPLQCLRAEIEARDRFSGSFSVSLY